jgi:hypothetical protein
LAAKAYSEAADFYNAEGNRQSDYNTMRLKVAELSTLKAGGDLVEAIKVFNKYTYLLFRSLKKLEINIWKIN